MLAMQYSVPLPVNYDADKIRERVNTRRALFDEHAGLVHKSFIYSAEDHLYAPFYVWKDAGEAQAFLLDELFKGVIETFSRRRVRSWIVLSLRYGDKVITPTYARHEIDPIAPEVRLNEWAEQERQAQAAQLNTHPGLYMHLIALDADRWEVLRYSLWESRESAPKPGTDCYQGYDVLHVSEPL